MPNIAIIDDNKDNGDTLLRLLSIYVGKEWGVVFSEPFESVEEYQAWFVEKDIWAVLLDWRLWGHASDGGKGVDYTAARVIKAIRSWRRDFPIFVVTSFDLTKESEDYFAEVEHFQKRMEFLDELSIYAKRMIRAANGFRVAHEKTLARISQLAQKAAEGTIESEEEDELDAARSSLDLRDVSQPREVLVALQEADELKARVQSLIEEIEKGKSQ